MPGPCVWLSVDESLLDLETAAGSLQKQMSLEDEWPCSTMLKKHCVAVQNLQYKFLDWKWPLPPIWNFSENSSFFVKATHRINYIKYEYCLK